MTRSWDDPHHDLTRHPRHHPADAALTPWPLRPELRRRPWGGTGLDARWPGAGAGREPGVEPIGEAWLAGPDTLVAAGADAGTRLAELAGRHGRALLGTAPWARYGDRFPLLVKLLDAAAPLSLQVHPDDAYARRHEAASGHLGKTEAWWVLDAAPCATVWWGFRRPTGRAEVAAAIADGTLAGLLRRLPVAPGDVVVNPAGTVHALGAGLTVYEVQQASDLTYRLDDHGRVGADGRPRPLHVEAALAVAAYAPGASPAPAPIERGAGRTELARTDAFVLEAVTGDADAGGPARTWRVGGGSFELLTHLAPPAGDAGRLTWAGGSVLLAPNATWLLPAGLGDVRLAGGTTYARAWMPDARAAS